MKNKSVHSCRFVHHAKFHCIMTTLNKLFKIEFERGGGETGKEPNFWNNCPIGLVPTLVYAFRAQWSGYNVSTHILDLL